jgi:hypothetical protein
MEPIFKEILWRQFGAAIDMLGNAVEACPEHIWSAPARDAARHTEFWYMAFHALFFLDLCLSGSVEGFAPPPPFGLEELDPAGIIPEQPYRKEEVTRYVVHCRDKCRKVIHGLNGDTAARHCHFPWLDISFGELQLYNLRHVQHHAGQLNLILRQTTNAAPGWVRSAESL